MPALVVPSAGNPASSKTRALAASHAFGRSRRPAWFSSRKRAARVINSAGLIPIVLISGPDRFVRRGDCFAQLLRAFLATDFDDLSSNRHLDGVRVQLAVTGGAGVFTHEVLRLRSVFERTQ